MTRIYKVLLKFILEDFENFVFDKLELKETKDSFSICKADKLKKNKLKKNQAK